MDWPDITDKFYCNSDTYPNSGVPKIPFYISTSLEIVTLLIILFFIVWRWEFRKDHRLTKLRDITTLVLAVISIIDIFIAMIRYWSMFIAVIIRPIFVISTQEQVWRAFRNILKVIWWSKEILILYISYILMFGWIAFRLFRGTVEGSSVCPDLGTCCWNLLIQLTTANFPDVMLPAYGMNTAYLIFFLFYMIFGLYFLHNLFMAIMYSNYKMFIEEQ